MTSVECFSVFMPNDFMEIKDDLTPFEATVASAMIMPSNQAFYSWFSVTFSFTVNLQSNTLIRIKVSKKTLSISDNIQIECYSYSGFSLFKDCKSVTEGIDLYITFTLLDRYTANTNLTVDVVGYSRFIQSEDGLTFDKVSIDDFYVSAYNGADLIAQSTNRLQTPIYLYDAPQTKAFDVNLAINPKNEAEISRYTFTFIFDYLRIMETDKIWIRFPSEYDISLGSRELQVTSTLKGAFKVTRRNREVIVYDLHEQSLKSQFTLELYGIQNPNRNSKDQLSDFLVGLMGSDNQLRYKITVTTGPYLVETPNIFELVALSSTNDIFRTDNSIDLSLNSKKVMPDSSKGGEIRVLFSSDFIMDVFFARCSTQEAYALYSFCTLQDNLLAIQSANKDYNSEITGEVQAHVTDIRNSEEEGYSGNLIAYNVNKQTNTVITRSFPNLSISYLKYLSDGLDIIVNDNEPIQLEVGSFSDPILIMALESIKQRINILPLYYDSAFLFSKNPIVLTKGDVNETFSLAVPQDMLHNRFYITFKKAGDLFPQFYATLPKIAVDVVSVKNKRKVKFEDTLYANRGGMSIPMKISTPNFPYQLVRVDIRVVNDFSGQVTLLNPYVELTNVQGSGYFRVANISSDFPYDTLELEYKLSGPNSLSFELSATKLSIPVNTQDPNHPSLKKLALLSINRSSAKFAVECDRLCYIHCVTGYLVK